MEDQLEAGEIEAAAEQTVIVEESAKVEQETNSREPSKTEPSKTEQEIDNEKSVEPDQTIAEPTTIIDEPAAVEQPAKEIAVTEPLVVIEAVEQQIVGEESKSPGSQEITTEAAKTEAKLDLTKAEKIPAKEETTAEAVTSEQKDKPKIALQKVVWDNTFGETSKRPVFTGEKDMAAMREKLMQKRKGPQGQSEDKAEIKAEPRRIKPRRRLKEV